MIKQTMIKPSSINVCDQFEKPWLKIHGNTTNRIPTNPIPKIVNKAMIKVFSFMSQGTLPIGYVRKDFNSSIPKM